MTKENYACECDECNKKLGSALSDGMLHLFIGLNDSNYLCNRNDFEINLNYESVMTWNVGREKYYRYYFYLDLNENLIAWYDNAEHCGFK